MTPPCRTDALHELPVNSLCSRTERNERLRHAPRVCRRIHAMVISRMTSQMTLPSAEQGHGLKRSIYTRVGSDVITLRLSKYILINWFFTSQRFVISTSGWRFHSSTCQSFKETVKMDIFGHSSWLCYCYLASPSFHLATIGLHLGFALYRSSTLVRDNNQFSRKNNKISLIKMVAIE